MSERVTLTLRAPPAGRVVADAVVPDRFAALSNREIAALPIWLARPGLAAADQPASELCSPTSNVQRLTSNPQRPASNPHTVPLGELFEVRGERSSDVHISGDLRRIDRLGAAMNGGALMLEGDAGREIGWMMRGGTVVVSGSVGSDAGLAMAAGTLTVSGNAGERLGGPTPGASRGMIGGEIFVSGHAERGAATAVRRGLIVIGGDTVDAGEAMIAGTLLVGGSIAGSVGRWNKRGSIITVGGATVPPSYRYACTYRPPYLRLLFRYLRSRDVPIDDRVMFGSFARYCGDMSQVGKGELLVWSGQR